MDTYSFRVYQIELSQAGDVSVISSTVRESDTDMVVEEFDPIERSVEFEDNLYKLDNTEMVVSGLPESYFKSYSTADDVDGGNYKPFIAEIRKGPQSSWNSNEVLFHGLIDPSSVRFSQRTERTKFKVWSWDRIISEAGKVPARSVLEADIAEMPDYRDITEGKVTIKVADGDVRKGDIAEFNVETQGPVRSAVRKIRPKPGEEYQEVDVAVPIGDNPDIKNKTPDNKQNGEYPFYPYTGDSSGRFVLRFDENPIEGDDGTSVYDLIYDGGEKRVYVRLTNENTGERFILPFEPAENDALASFVGARELWFRDTIFASIPDFSLPDTNDALRVDFYGKKLFSGIGKTIKFYGRSAYGYDPTDGGTNPGADFVIAGTDSNGDPEGLIPAIFSLSGSGYLDTLESVVDTFVVPTSEDNEDYIEDRQTFPTDLEKSLRAIARSAPAYVNLVPTKDSQDPSLPRLEVRVTPRSLAVNQTPSTFAGIVKEWNENVIDEPLNAVKVTTEGIGKPEGYGPLAGWHPAQNIGNASIWATDSSTKSIFVDYYDENLSSGDTIRVDGKNEGRDLGSEYTVDSTAKVYAIGGGVNSMRIFVQEAVPDIEPGVNEYGRARWRTTGSTMPDGDSEVIEFETLTWPSFSGPEVADGDDRIVKDSQLSTVARYYYEFLNQLGAKGSATLEGAYPNIVGDKLQFSVPKYKTEGGSEVNRIAYITKTEVDYEKGETEIEFRRGTFTEPKGSALIPRIEVQDTAFVRSGTVTTVAFDAEKTSAPAGSDYLWEVDTTGDGTFDTTASSKYLNLDLGTGTYDWKFTVTTPDGQTRTDTGSVRVKEDPTEESEVPSVKFDAYEITGNPRKGRLDVIVQPDGKAPANVFISAKQSGNLPEPQGTPDASKSYVHKNPNASTLSNGATRYRYTIDLAEGHISEIQGYVQHTTSRQVAPDISEQFQFDANNVPAPSYSWNWEYRPADDAYDLYLVWSGSVDTASVRFDFHADGDTSTSPDNTVTADGRNGRVQVNTNPISSNASVAVSAKAFNETGQAGAEESDPPTFNISSPLGGDTIDPGNLDDRYLLESGDRINGPLEIGGAGEFAASGSGYLELLDVGGGNTAEFRLKKLTVDQLDVTGDINQKNETNLAVEDRWIETNVGGGDQDAGLIVNRGSTDAYMMWEEGYDAFGQRVGSGGTFERFVRERDTSGLGTYSGSLSQYALARAPVQVWPDSGATDAPQVHVGTLAGLPKKGGDGTIPDPNDTYTSSQYGIWLRPGDEAIVEGDTSFRGGSWIVEENGSFLIEEGIDGSPLLRMGTATVSLFGTSEARRGFHAYDGNGNIQAFFTRDGFSFAGGALEGDASSLAIDVSDFTLSSAGLSVDSTDETIELGSNLFNTGILLDAANERIRMYDSDFGSTESEDALRIGSEEGIPTGVGVITDTTLTKIDSSVPEGSASKTVSRSFTVNDKLAPIDLPVEVFVDYNGQRNNFIIEARLKTQSGEVLASQRKTENNRTSLANTYELDLSASPLDKDNNITLEVEVAAQGVIDSQDRLDFVAESNISGGINGFDVTQYQPRLVLNSRGIFARYAPNKIASIFNSEGSSGGSGGGSVLSVFGRTGNVSPQSGDYSASQIDGFDSAAVSAVNGSQIKPGGIDVESRSNNNHINVDGSFYRTDGQAHITVDDKLYIRDQQDGPSSAGGTFLFETDQNEIRVNGSTVWHDGNADSKAVSAVESAGTIDLTNTRLKWDQDSDGAILEIKDYGDNKDYLTLTVNDDNGDAFRIRHEDADGNIVNVADFDRDGLELPRGATISGNTVTTINNLTASGNNLNTDWNNESQFAVEGANNRIGFIVPSETNVREAAIQVGHDNPNFSNLLGKLILNPLGGKVGIGTTSPTKTLTVNGDAQFRGGNEHVYIGDFNNIDTQGRSGSYPAIAADNVLRVGARMEIWGNGNGNYFDVRDTNGNVGAKITGDGSKSYIGANGGRLEIQNVLEFDNFLNDGDILIDFNVHRSYDIRRIGSNDSGAGLYLNSDLGGNEWGFSYNGTKLMEIGGGDGTVFKNAPVTIQGTFNANGKVDFSGANSVILPTM